MNVGFAVGKIKCLDIGHGGKHPNDGLVGVNIGHRMLGVGGVRVDAKFAVDETFDTSLETVLETVFTGGRLIIYSTPGKITSSIDESVHLGMDDEVVFHGALVHGHFGFVSTLWETIVAKRNYAFISIYDCAAHFG